MSRITWYNFEKYSIIDVKNYLELSGYETEIIPESGSCAAKLHVKGTDIHVDFPVIDINATILADIRFESYPKMENYEKSRKLYTLLKRKFARQNGDNPETIKDAGRLHIADYSKGIIRHLPRAIRDALSKKRKWIKCA